MASEGGVTGHIDEVEGDRGLVRDALERVGRANMAHIRQSRVCWSGQGQAAKRDCTKHVRPLSESNRERTLFEREIEREGG